jgi:peptidoglycan/xylan/chitin deacetylase (PgdA/CDA1 family)
LVALSFDDGPHEVLTPQVLEILERYGATATFFLIGERAERHPELVERIRAAGHEIGNHCWRDGSVLGHSEARFEEELERTETAIGLGALRRRKEEGKEKDLTQRTRREEHREHGESAGQKAGLIAPTAKEGPSQPFNFVQDKESAPTTACSSLWFFRAPGGVAWPWQLRLARERGYTCVLGCAYPHDPMRPPVKYIRWLIEKNLVPGTIVILHDGIRDARRSIEALPHILEEGKRRGLRFVSIGELVDSRDGSKAGHYRRLCE